MVSWWGILEQGRHTWSKNDWEWVRPLYGGGQCWAPGVICSAKNRALTSWTYVLGKDRNKLVRKGAQKEDSSGCEEKSSWLTEDLEEGVSEWPLEECSETVASDRRGSAVWVAREGLYRPVFLIVLSNSSWYDMWKGRNYCRNWVLPELITIKNYNIMKYSGLNTALTSPRFPVLQCGRCACHELRQKMVCSIDLHSYCWKNLL